MTGGQWVISDVILQFAKQVDFDGATGFAEKWYPDGKGGRTVLDPQISFGAPTIIGKGIRTSNVYDLFRAENEQIQSVADWMDLEGQDITAAVQFEQALAA